MGKSNVCDNLADHMVGNVYVQFQEEDHAVKALQKLSGRYYAGRPIIVEFSPVTDFREATCRQYEENLCNRGGYCNFMHLKRISRELRRELFVMYRRRCSHSHSRSRSPYRHQSYERDHRESRSRRYDDRDHRESRSRRRRSTSPVHRQGRSRSRSRGPESRRNRSPIREGSEERRAKIEQWNREREQKENASDLNSSGRKNDSENTCNGYTQYGNQYCGYEEQQQHHEHQGSYGY